MTTAGKGGRDGRLPLDSPSVSFRALPRHAGWLSAWLAEWDLSVLLLLLLADVRVFKGSSVASFTLFELFAWCYCAPVVIGHMLSTRRLLPPLIARFVGPLGLYLAWILLASLFALLARQHSDVLQEAKNILPALPLVCFIGIRVKRPATVARLANIYVLYCFAACVLALVQLEHGGPYFRPPIDNNEYKADFSGDLVGNVVLGFASTPNELALIVLPGLMFSAIKLAYELRERRIPRLLTLACCAATGTVFLLAQSRGAVIWFLFGLAFLVAPTRHGRSFVLKLSLVMALIVLIVGYGMHADPASPEIENTIRVRYLLWKTSLAAMASDPYVAVLGDGMAYVETWSWTIAGWEFPDAHNGWLDQALFFGWPALVLYLMIWWRFFAITDEAANSSSIPPNARVLLDGIRASVLSFMGLNFFEPVAHAVFPVSQLFLLMSCGVGLAGLSARVVAAQADRQTELPRPS